MKQNIFRLIMLLCVFPLSGAALAHTGNHDVSGFLSGVSHPLMGLDHLLVMLAVGVWVGLNARASGWMLMGVFLAFMVTGALLSVGGFVLPALEEGITVSLLVMGVLIATMAKLPTTFSAVLLGVFALFHGSGHGVEMPIAATPWLYGMGLLFATAVLNLTGLGLARLLQRAQAQWLLRGAGVTASGLGIWSLLGA